MVIAFLCNHIVEVENSNISLILRASTRESAMSVLAAAIKNGEVAIACDTQCSFGSLIVDSRNLHNHNKLYVIKDCVVGVIGWSAVACAIENLMSSKAEMLDFTNRRAIYATFLKIHPILRDEYYIEDDEDEEQPAESSQVSALIINRNGIFEVGRFREVNQFNKYWATGAGRKLALGAMYASYTTSASASDVVKAGVLAASEFDDSCSGPAIIETLKHHRSVAGS